MTSEREPNRMWPLIQGFGVALVLALFLWSSRAILNPLFLFVVLIVAFHPFRGRPGHALLVTLAGMITAVWVLSTTGSLLAPFILALGVAYLFDPVVDRIEATGRGRTTSVVLLALPVVGGVVAIILFGIPALSGQVSSLVDQAPEALSRLGEWVSSQQSRLREVPWLRELVAEPLADLDQEAIAAFIEERREMLAQRAWDGVVGLGKGIGTVITVLGYLVITPVLAFYLLRDWDEVTEHLEGLLPPNRREGVVSFLREYDRLLARYLRGQILVALIVGSITALGLWISSFPYALLIGVLVAIFGVIPYLGLVLSLIPAVIVALTSGAIGVSLLKVAMVFAVAQGLEGSVISPRIVGDSVGLHPVWVVLALTAGGYYFGFVGLLLAVPFAVGVKLVVERGIERYRRSAVYLGEELDRKV